MSDKRNTTQGNGVSKGLIESHKPFEDEDGEELLKFMEYETGSRRWRQIWEDGIKTLSDLMEVAGLDEMIEELKSKGRHDKGANDRCLASMIILREEAWDLRRAMRGRIDVLRKHSNKPIVPFKEE